MQVVIQVLHTVLCGCHDLSNTWLISKESVALTSMWWTLSPGKQIIVQFDLTGATDYELSGMSAGKVLQMTSHPLCGQSRLYTQHTGVYTRGCWSRCSVHYTGSSTSTWLGLEGIDNSPEKWVVAWIINLKSRVCFNRPATSNMTKQVINQAVSLIFNITGCFICMKNKGVDVFIVFKAWTHMDYM